MRQLLITIIIVACIIFAVALIPDFRGFAHFMLVSLDLKSPPNSAKILEEFENTNMVIKLQPLTLKTIEEIESIALKQIDPIKKQKEIEAEYNNTLKTIGIFLKLDSLSTKTSNELIDFKETSIKQIKDITEKLKIYLKENDMKSSFISIHSGPNASNEKMVLQNIMDVTKAANIFNSLNFNSLIEFKNPIPVLQVLNYYKLSRIKPYLKSQIRKRKSIPPDKLIQIEKSLDSLVFEKEFINGIPVLKIQNTLFPDLTAYTVFVSKRIIFISTNIDSLKDYLKLAYQSQFNLSFSKIKESDLVAHESKVIELQLYVRRVLKNLPILKMMLGSILDKLNKISIDLELSNFFNLRFTGQFDQASDAVAFHELLKGFEKDFKRPSASKENSKIDLSEIENWIKSHFNFTLNNQNLSHNFNFKFSELDELFKKITDQVYKDQNKKLQLAKKLRDYIRVNNLTKLDLMQLDTSKGEPNNLSYKSTNNLLFYNEYKIQDFNKTTTRPFAIALQVICPSNYHAKVSFKPASQLSRIPFDDLAPSEPSAPSAPSNETWTIPPDNNDIIVLKVDKDPYLVSTLALKDQMIGKMNQKSNIKSTNSILKSKKLLIDNEDKTNLSLSNPIVSISIESMGPSSGYNPVSNFAVKKEVVQIPNSANPPNVNDLINKNQLSPCREIISPVLFVQTR